MAILFLVVYLLLNMLIPAQLVLHPLGAAGTPANLWAIAGLVWWVCAAIGRLDAGAVTTPIRIIAGLLAATILASYANGMASGWYTPPGTHQYFDDVYTLVRETLSQVQTIEVNAADRGLMVAAGWLAVMLVAGEGLRSWRDVDHIVGWMVWLGAVVAGIAVIEYTTGLSVVRYLTLPGLSANTDLAGIGERSVLNRVSATAVHPIEFGVVMACLFPLALHWTMQRPGHRLALLPTGLIFVGAFLSVSRSAMLDMAVVGIVLFAGWPARLRLKALVLTPLAVVGVRLLFPGLVGTLVSLFTNLGNDPSVSGRTDDYHLVFDLVGDHPWLGRGLFTFVPREYRILDNQWLSMVLELGLVGTGVVFLVMLTAFLCARTAFRHAPTSSGRSLGLSISASIAGAVVSMVTFDAWSYRMHSGLTFLLMGMAGAVWRLSRPAEDPGRAPQLAQTGLDSVRSVSPGQMHADGHS
ncbi:O-antigen ligase family protein [Nocardioides dilutus]